MYAPPKIKKIFENQAKKYNEIYKIINKEESIVDEKIIKEEPKIDMKDELSNFLQQLT